VAAIGAAAYARPGAAAQPAPATFTRDVAPILFAHCSSCHQPGGSAPFSLLTYEDVRARADRIAAVTASRYMPPWKPEPGYGEFADARRLTDVQIATIRRWVADGTMRGDPAAMPAAPPRGEGWQLGTPDLVVSMDRAYTVPATGDDVYRHFVIPIPVTERKFVRAWELRADSARVLHHATMEIDRTGMSQHLDMQDPAPGYEGLIAHTTMAPDGYFLDWAPGHTPYRAPDGMAFPIEPGSDLVLMLHLRPSGTPQPVQVKVAFYFSTTPPMRVPALLRLTRQDLDIPAGESRHVVASSFRTPVDLELFTVQPHAHNVARQVEGRAVLPDGTQKRLLLVKDWDFNWQGVYRYATPVLLPAGSTVTATWTYDNSAANPRNPNRPPRPVRFGQRTSDEMAELWFQVVPRNSHDRDVLTRSLQSHLLPQNIKGYEMMIRADPANASLHDDVALLYAQAGDVNGVAAHFAESARLRPGSASGQYNLGSARLLQGRRDEARSAFERAIGIDPAYANAYRGLATVLYRDGRLDDAARAYQRAIELAPGDVSARHNYGVLLHAQGKLADAVVQYEAALQLDDRYADAHYGLALVFKAQGDTAKAIEQYRAALRSVPDWPEVLSELAVALATASDPGVRDVQEALRVAERGVTSAAVSSQATIAALDAHAVALAAAGRFIEAADRARQALSAARAAGNETAAKAIEDRLRSYEAAQPAAPR
jgi:tetratricopeptide (TPR) repeat protein/mono/diheme cytochrome c family protein